MKLLHAADLHIDSPLRGLAAYEGAPADRIRGATRRAMTALVDLACTEAVDMVLLAGDVFDGNWKDYSTGQFFHNELVRLRNAGIRVCHIAGNHDAESQITRQLTLPDTVTTFRTDRPETRVFEDIGLAVHGQGFATKAVNENLARAYPAAHAGLFNVGLLHTALDGDPAGRVHKPYAPCTVEDLRAHGYDYWALGHVHARAVASQEPWVVFPGNLQGRHARETGPKGATLVTVDERGRATVEERTLDVVRWDHLTVDVSTAAHPDDVHALVRDALTAAVSRAGGRLLATRVTVAGATDAHEALCRDWEAFTAQLRADAAVVGDVWLEKIRIATSHPQDTAEVPELVDDVRRTAAAMRADRDALETLVRKIPVLGKLPADVADEGLDPDDEAWRDRMFDEAVDLLTAMLSGGEAR